MDEKTCVAWLKVYDAFCYSLSKLLFLLSKMSVVELSNLKQGRLQALGCSGYVQDRLLCPDKKRLTETLKWLEEDKHHLITLDQASYPPLLRHIGQPPPLLFVAGELDLLTQPQLAIVGSRQASQSALALAHEWAHDLSGRVLITSGLALGVDAAAHKGALLAGQRTLAVLGSGLLNIYPRQNRQLASQLTDFGALISEFPLRAAPAAHHFPRRNRIISGLSLATLIIEARLKSGSLITAEFAMEQGREVLVVPGSIRNPMAAGSNKLLQMGAQVVTQFADLEQALPEIQGLTELDKSLSNQRSSSKPLDLGTARLLECVGFEPTGMDVILHRCQLPVASAAAKLTELELAGYIYKEAIGYTRVK